MAAIADRSRDDSSGDGFFDPNEDVIQRAHHLPHWHQDQAHVFVTWRLADSLPHGRLQDWRQEKAGWLAAHPTPWGPPVAAEYRARFGQTIDRWLDAREGACVLREPRPAALVAAALTHFDGMRYALDSFVVMPNHIHVLFRLGAGHALGAVVHTWKSYSANAVNRALGRAGALWHDDYWDRLVRDEGHLASSRDYIRDNPAKGRLGAGEYLLYQAD